jgi:hypothetical protein
MYNIQDGTFIGVHPSFQIKVVDFLFCSIDDAYELWVQVIKLEDKN